jgi:mannose-6-phosphate isomerase-like protein (cupin superfamily)
VPYVSVDEAQNASVLDVGATLRELGLGRPRALLVASDALRVVLLRMRPGEEPHRPHRHPGADEAMLVMDGRGTFTVGSEPGFVAGPGSLVYVPRGVVHRIQVTGPEPLAWLSIVAPNQDAPDEAVEEEG